MESDPIFPLRSGHRFLALDAARKYVASVPTLPTMPKLAVLALIPAFVTTIAAQPRPTVPLDSALYKGISWRNVGPSRGGRSVAAAGIPSQPLTYFAGYTGGGVWRTDDAGIS